jgi:hypothetical protein
VIKISLFIKKNFNIMKNYKFYQFNFSYSSLFTSSLGFLVRHMKIV